MKRTILIILLIAGLAYLLLYFRRPNPPKLSNYDLLELNLSIPRNDELIASNVSYLKIFDYSPDAIFQLKLFSPNNRALDQSFLMKGTEIVDLDNANIYLSNTAQLNKKLVIFVFKHG